MSNAKLYQQCRATYLLFLNLDIHVYAPYIVAIVAMCLQCISEMAIMTGYKRMELEECVKPNKSDEKSAMFNMIMFKKQREKGRLHVTMTSCVSVTFDVTSHRCKRPKNITFNNVLC